MLSFPDDHMHPYSPLNLLYPAFNCPHGLERVGRPGDGGIWVYGMDILTTRIPQRCEDRMVIFSRGIKDDSSFEQVFLDRTDCEAWNFDPFVPSWGLPLEETLSGNLEVESRTKFAMLRVSGRAEVRNSQQF
jgi:hypothetical protein